MAFVVATGEFVASILLYTHRTQPAAVAIYSEYQQHEYGTAAATGTLLMIVVLALAGVLGLVTSAARRDASLRDRDDARFVSNGPNFSTVPSGQRTSTASTRARGAEPEVEPRIVGREVAPRRPHLRTRASRRRRSRARARRRRRAARRVERSAQLEERAAAAASRSAAAAPARRGSPPGRRRRRRRRSRRTPRRVRSPRAGRPGPAAADTSVNVPFEPLPQELVGLRVDVVALNELGVELDAAVRDEDVEQAVEVGVEHPRPEAREPPRRSREPPTRRRVVELRPAVQVEDVPLAIEVHLPEVEACGRRRSPPTRRPCRPGTCRPR